MTPEIDAAIADILGDRSMTQVGADIGLAHTAIMRLRRGNPRPGTLAALATEPKPLTTTLPGCML